MKTFRSYLTDGPDWRLAPYCPGDEVEILKLFKQVFGVERTRERWNWEYAENRAGQYHIMLAKNPEGEVIGHVSGIPVFAKYNDRQYIFEQLVDFMVRSDHRGRQKGDYLFIQLAYKYMDEFAREDAESVLYGIPNEVAFRSSTLSGNFPYQPLDPIIYFTKSIRERKAFSPADINVTFQPIDEFGYEAQEIWSQHKDNYPITIIKDQNYLNWRYCKCPDIQYFKLLIHLDNRPIGYLVMKDSFDGEKHNFPNEKLGVVVDWIVSRKYEILYEQIMACCERWASDKHIDRILILFPKHSREYQFLRKMGYEEFVSRYKFGAKSFNEKINLKKLNKNWFYTLGDFDIV